MDYQGVKESCPEDTCGDSLEFAQWKSRGHKHERDMYLSLSCLLAHGLLISICHYKDKFDRYVEFKIQEENEQVGKPKR